MFVADHLLHWISAAVYSRFFRGEIRGEGDYGGDWMGMRGGRILSRWGGGAVLCFQVMRK